jgi:hypothetical protein
MTCAWMFHYKFQRKIEHDGSLFKLSWHENYQDNMIFKGQDENKGSSKSKSWDMKTKYNNSEHEFYKM